MPLLERDAYLEMLEAALARSAAGTGTVALVSGEAGMGKTSLLQEFAARNPKTRIYWGGCEALFTPHPLAPLYDIARQMGGDLGKAISSASNRHEIFNATLERLAEMPAPTVGIIEDAHWADEATLDLIKFLGRRLQHLGLMLVVSYRDDAIYDKHPLRSVLGDLIPRSVSRIALPSLTESAVEQLARASGRDPGDLHAVTGGNPFFVTEVLATAGSQVPATVRDAVIARLARLSEPARKVAYLVSIVPGKAESWLVSRATGAGADAVAECLNAGMVAYPDSSLGFRHELARRAVEDSIAATERQILNANALAALLERGADQVAVGRLVHHADRAGDSAAVLRYAPLAAERAAEVGAHRESVFYLQTALRHGASLGDEQRALFLERLSYGQYLTDQIAEAVQTREQALALWRSQGHRLHEGDTLRWMSRLSWFNGQKANAERYAREAVSVLESLPAGRELAMAYSNRSQLYMLADNAGPAIEWGNKALALAESLGDLEIQAHALNNIGTSKLAQNEDMSGRDDLEKALQIALDNGMQEHAARAYTNLASTPARQRNYVMSAQYLKAGIAYCEERDLDAWTRYMTAIRAETSLALGNWNEASLEADSILRHAGAAPVTKIPSLTVIGRLRARRGDPDVETPLFEAYRLAVPTGELQRLAPVLAARAEAAWLQGTAPADLLVALEAAYWSSLEQSDPWIRSELAFWLWRHGRLERSPADIAKPFGLQIAGDWRAAAEAWGAIHCPYERAVALTDGNEEEALREALQVFEQLGAAPMAAIVRRKLRASGVRRIPRGAQERTRQNPAGMTNQELKVLTLLMEGCRNAEIARRLFVSEKTVGHHVSSVLAKLGVHSRGEAAAAAKKLGLSPDNK